MSQDLSHCPQCGTEIPLEKQRKFRAHSLWKINQGATPPAGPFCNVRCRSNWFSDIAEAKFKAAVRRNDEMEQPPLTRNDEN